MTTFFISTPDGTIGRFAIEVHEVGDEGDLKEKLKSCGVAGDASKIDSILERISVLYPKSDFSEQAKRRSS